MGLGWCLIDARGTGRGRILMQWGESHRGIEEAGCATDSRRSEVRENGSRSTAYSMVIMVKLLPRLGS